MSIIDELLRGKKSPMTSAPSETSEASGTSGPEPLAPPAPPNPFAALKKMNLGGGAALPKIALKSISAKSAAVDSQLDAINNTGLVVGGAIPTRYTPSTPSIQPSLDPELAAEADKPIRHYKEQVKVWADQPAVQTLYNNLLKLVESLQTDEIGNEFYKTMQYLELNPELRQLLLPHDVSLLVKAIQASTGRVIKKKVERSVKATVKAKRLTDMENMMGDMSFGI